MGRRKALTKGESEALATLFFYLIAAVVVLAAIPFVLTFYAVRAFYRSFKHHQEQQRSPFPVPAAPGVYPLWLTTTGIIFAAGFWLFALVLLPQQQRSEVEARQRAQLAFDEQQRQAHAATRAQFESSRPRLEQQLQHAREQGNSAELSRIASVFAPFDDAVAQQIRAEIELLALAESCAPRGTICPLDEIENARSRGVTQLTIDRVRSACAQRYLAARPLPTINLSGMTAFALRGWRIDALCLQRLSGQMPNPSIAQYDAAIARVERRELRAAEQQAREAAPPPEPSSGSGGNWRSSGRCRDSRGRFARCW